MSKPAAQCKVYSRFERKQKDGTVLKFIIQDLPDDRKEEEMELYSEVLVKEEPIFRAIGMYGDPAAMAEAKQYRAAMVDEEGSVVFVCLVDDGSTKPPLAGGSWMTVEKEEPDLSELEVNHPKLKKFVNTVGVMMSFSNVKKAKGVSVTASGRYIGVDPKYRGNGIALEFVKARRQYCKEHGIPLTDATMTAYGTQKAAAKDNWETVKEYTFEELGKAAGLVFTDTPPTVKVMVAEIK